MDGGKDASRAADASTAEGSAMTEASAKTVAPAATPVASAVAGSARATGATEERPPLVGQISYVFSGRMPPRYAGWVFQDLTGPGWRLRQALRSALMMLPFAIILAVLPGPVGTRAMLDAFLMVAAAAMGLVLSGAFRNRRLVQNGFPPIVKPEEDELRALAPTAVASPARAEAAAPGRADAGTAASPAAARAATRHVDPDDPDDINA